MSRTAAEPAGPASTPPDGASLHFRPLIRPDLAELYSRRAARLRKLAEGHVLADYLHLAANVAEAQAALLPKARPGTSTDPRIVGQEGHWIFLLDGLIERLVPLAPAPVVPHLMALRDLPETARLSAALALAEGRFGAIPASIAPFVWAALSLQCAGAARSASSPENALTEHACCPVCGVAPVASLILTGDNEGFRYLHCALCECAWHMVRAKCTNCGTASELEYLSLDTIDAAVRAESCNVCHGYLKVISLERDPLAEAVADDLATLVLDDAVTAEGYQRTGFNPFALPE